MSSTKLQDMDFAAVMDIIADPDKHRGELTFGEFVQLIDAVSKAATAVKGLQQPAQPTESITALERKTKDLETRLKSIEEKMEAIQRAFGGGYYD